MRVQANQFTTKFTIDCKYIRVKNEGWVSNPIYVEI